MLLSTYWIINLGILFAISWSMSSNWLMLWGMMEFNSFMYVFLLLIIAPLLAPAYFIPQTIAALMFVFYLLPWPSSWLILTVFIMLKLPLMPLHMWFVSLTLTLPLLPLLILHSFQKLIPLLFIMLYKIGPLTFSLSLMSMLTAGVTGLIAPNPLWLLAFSSILNNTWLMSLSFSSPLLMSVGYFFYTAMVSTIMLSSFNMSFKFLPMSWQLFSLVGVPPLPGFFFKIFTFNHSIPPYNWGYKGHYSYFHPFTYYFLYKNTFVNWDPRIKFFSSLLSFFKSSYYKFYLHMTIHFQYSSFYLPMKKFKVMIFLG